jgi:hypothetical protein
LHQKASRKKMAVHDLGRAPFLAHEQHNFNQRKIYDEHKKAHLHLRGWMLEAISRLVFPFYS